MKTHSYALSFFSLSLSISLSQTQHHTPIVTPFFSPSHARSLPLSLLHMHKHTHAHTHTNTHTHTDTHTHTQTHTHTHTLAQLLHTCTNAVSVPGIKKHSPTINTSTHHQHIHAPLTHSPNLARKNQIFKITAFPTDTHTFSLSHTPLQTHTLPLSLSPLPAPPTCTKAVSGPSVGIYSRGLRPSSSARRLVE